MLTQEAAQKLCLLFAETVLQLMKRAAKMDDEDVNRLGSDENVDTNELRLHLRGFDDCTRILDYCRAEELFGKQFKEEIVRSGSDSSVPGEVMYWKDALAT